MPHIGASEAQACHVYHVMHILRLHTDLDWHVVISCRWSTLTSLEILNLGENSLEGPLPATFEGLRKLTVRAVAISSSRIAL